MANLILNPSFEVDSNSDGLADNWTLSKTVSGTVTTSRVAGLFGSYAQRLAYTSSSDSAKSFNIISDKSAVGSVSAGSVITAGVWLYLAYTGAITFQVYIHCYNAAGTSLGSSNINYASPPAGSWLPLIGYYASAPANTSTAALQVVATAIDTGDSVTLDVDGAYLSPDANFDHYGKYPVIGKGAVLL